MGGKVGNVKEEWLVLVSISKKVKGIVCILLGNVPHPPLQHLPMPSPVNSDEIKVQLTVQKQLAVLG